MCADGAEAAEVDNATFHFNEVDNGLSEDDVSLRGWFMLCFVVPCFLGGCKGR